MNNEYLELTKKPAYDGEDPESDLTVDQKKEYAKGFFDDAFTYYFNMEIAPRHIHFEVQTTDTELETCDVHLYSLESTKLNA